MKKVLLIAIAASGLLFASASQSNAGISVGIGVGVPVGYGYGYFPYPYYYGACPVPYTPGEARLVRSRGHRVFFGHRWGGGRRWH